jgi:hypothetical protein
MAERAAQASSPGLDDDPPGGKAPHGKRGFAGTSQGWPREESNLRARIRSPSLYPLSYGARPERTAARKPGSLTLCPA